MPLFEIKIKGKDQNIYYLDVLAPDEKSARQMAMEAYCGLSFSILEVNRQGWDSSFRPMQTAISLRSGELAM